MAEHVCLKVYLVENGYALGTDLSVNLYVSNMVEQPRLLSLDKFSVLKICPTNSAHDVPIAS